MEEKLITLAKYSYSRAEVLKGRLESEGIDCYLKNINLVQGAPGSVKIRIRESDAEKAVRIIMDIEKEYSPNLWKSKLPDKKKGKILVPVDFSLQSYNAANFALSIAAKYEGEVFLFHSYYTIASELITISDTHATYSSLDLVLKEMEKNSLEELENLYNDLENVLISQKNDTVKINYSMSFGETEEEIINTAANYNPDLIVLGLKSQNKDISKRITYLIDNVKHPMLIVPDTYKLESFEQLDYNQNILYATDFSKSDYVTIRHLIRLLSDFNINLHLMHFCKNEKGKCDKVLMNELAKYIMSIKPDITVETHIIEYSKDINKKLKDLNINFNYSMLSLSHRKRDFIEKLIYPSFTKNILKDMEIPLLVFKD